MNRDSRTDWPVVGLGFFSFVVLGMPGALLNVAWSPPMRGTFGLPLEAVGVLYLASTSGYFAASSASGRWMHRYGIPRLLAVSTLVSMLGLLGLALAPRWWAVLLCSLLVGAGTGLLDGGMNIYFAASFGPRLMNWLHASFGIGATLGPLVMTGLLKGGHSWRWGYGLAAGLFGATTLLFLRTRDRWQLTPAGDPSPANRGASLQHTLRLPVVWLGISLFVACTGLEVSAAQWSFSLFTDSRRVSPAIAGLWISCYWGSFTGGRIFFGAILGWVRPSVVLRLCMIGMALSAALLGWRTAAGVGAVSLALFGFSLSPMFALMITQTQERLGPIHAPNAIGLQVAAAALGVGILPGLAGVLAKYRGLEIIPWFLLAVTLVMIVLFEAAQTVGDSGRTKRKKP